MKRAVISLVVCQLLVTGISPKALQAVVESKEKVWGEVREDQALVYLIRTGRFTGSARTTFVFADRELIGVLDSGTYTFAHLEPGSYLLWTNWTRVRREVDLIPGRTYYIDAWDDLKVLDPETGQALLDKVKAYATPKPKEIQTAEKYLENRHEEALAREEAQEKAEVASVAAMAEPADPSGYVEVPPYTEIRLELMENLTSYHNPTGTEVALRVLEDVVVDGETVISAGHRVVATVRHAEEGRSAGEGGEMDLVVGSLPMTDGSEVATMGRLSSSGRDQEGEAYALGFAFGIVGVLASRGQEAFLPAGARYVAATRYPHWVERGAEPASQAEEAPSESLLRVSGRSVHPLVFAPGKRKDPEPLEVQLEMEALPESVEVVAIGDATLERPIPAHWLRPPERGTGQRVRFDGWEVVRHSRLTGRTTTVRLGLRGVTADGERFEADVDLEIRLKGKGL